MSNSKFKVGDKVEVIFPGIDETGKRGVVINILNCSGDWRYRVDGTHPDIVQTFLETSLKLVEEAMKLSSGLEVVAKSKDKATVGCTLVTREDVVAVLAAMDGYVGEFKAGVFVKVTKQPSHYSSKRMIGQYGKIIRPSRDKTWQWDVEFAEPVPGGDCGHTLYCNEDGLEIVE